MEAKDQRLEVRVTQQHLVDLDTIRNSVNSPYIPTRSDVVRSFIDQGIARHLAGGERSQDEIPLGQRLNLYFQIQQMYAMETQGRNFENTLDIRGSNRHKSKITELMLVRQVYVQRMFWFFELDKESLASIHYNLANNTLCTLLNSEASDSACSDLAYVSEILNMFNDIDMVIAQGKCDGEYNDASKEALTTIKYLSTNSKIPLTFKGFTKSSLRLAEMAGLLNWVNRGEGGYHIAISTSSDDFMPVYNTMLDAYNTVMRDKHNLSLSKLIKMLENCRLAS
ncbi:hypothetical protein [Aeromonas veronii]|uniref:hypothetical protein n=1 Tax=Aeromonas veronii TaxID=654 RepID=UPI003B9FE248